jgi:DNA-binding NtrC family response regulator
MADGDPLVLVVDDRADAREYVDDLLTPEGYEVIQAASGEEALQLIARHPVRLVITDLEMPGVDGMELLDRVRDQHRDLPVIIFTGHGRLAIGLRAIAHGAFYFLDKPVPPDKLLALAEKALALRAERLAAS